MNDVVDKSSLAELSGGICCYHRGRSVADCAKLVFELLEKELDFIPITHIGGSYELECNLFPISQKSLGNLLDSVYRQILFGHCESEEAKKDKFPDMLQIILGDFHARGVDCIVLSFRINQSVLPGRIHQVTSFFDELAIQLNCESGHLHDLTDSVNQDRTNLQSFKLFGYTPPTDKTKWDTLYQEEVVDIEQNPSHSHLVKAVDFIAAWTNYLGREQLDYLGFDHAQDVVPILEDIAHEIVVLNDSLVRVTLFQDPFAFDHPENIERLWEFRRRLRIDEIAHELLPDHEKPSRYVDLPSK